VRLGIARSSSVVKCVVSYCDGGRPSTALRSSEKGGGACQIWLQLFIGPQPPGGVALQPHLVYSYLLLHCTWQQSGAVSLGYSSAAVVKAEGGPLSPYQPAWLLGLAWPVKSVVHSASCQAEPPAPSEGSVRVLRPSADASPQDLSSFCCGLNPAGGA
jgi:hypothetical protein